MLWHAYPKKCLQMLVSWICAGFHWVDAVRDTYASTLLTAGANPWHVAQQLGYGNVKMVFRTCGKCIQKDFQKPKADSRLA